MQTPSGKNNYEAVWQSTTFQDQHHDLADMRQVLDHHAYFDVINLHNLGSPYEIEHQIRWLQYEMQQRQFVKPIIISDTLPTSFIGWGAATSCKGKNLGLIAAPAQEADRCRLAEFFTRMVNDDKETLDWARHFIAADHVQRTFIAAEQGVRLINLSFIGDIPGATWKIFRAGAGLSAWGGAAEFKLPSGKLKQRYPLFYAIQQLMFYLKDYESVQRVPHPNEQIRLYRVQDKNLFVAWFDPQRLYLDDEPFPTLKAELNLGKGTYQLDTLATSATVPKVQPIKTNKQGYLELVLSPNPVYITALAMD